MEAGKHADLVLLDGDLVAGVANLHRITGVVRVGGYYSRRDLADMLAATQARIIAAPAD